MFLFLDRRPPDRRQNRHQRLCRLPTAQHHPPAEFAQGPS
jgi:hypothetical protein